MTWNPEIRQSIEDREIQFLSPYAVKSRFGRGRRKAEQPCQVRTEFQRDRDRIIHCKSFRRLKHKTQVFIAPAGDHFVTRLTHTLEVTQIARTIARALNLNEDLTEAIALGHDLGHTPFGHIGEEMLNTLYKKGFKHNKHSLRVVDKLEKEGKGLNLTWEVRDGILNHSKSTESILGENWGKTGSYEADVVKISDLVAYVNHDIDDATRAGIISPDDLPESAKKALGTNHRTRINTIVTDIIKTSWPVTYESENDKPVITMSKPVVKAASDLKTFLFNNVYNVQYELKESEEARQIIEKLYRYLCKHPEVMPLDYRNISDNVEAIAVDYIAGMTDHYAARLANTLYL